jgi:hypothetical protein
MSRNIDYYLSKIEEIGFGIEFDCLRAFSTAGDITPPYPYQWMATTKHRPGDDDVFEGVGGTPLEAVRDLYRTLKYWDWNTVEDY